MGTGGARETAPERGKFAGLCRGQAAAAGPTVLRTGETGFARLPAAGGRPAAAGGQVCILAPGPGVGQLQKAGAWACSRQAPAENGPAGPPRPAGRGVGGGRRPPPKAARRAACPAGRGAGYAGAGRESVPCTGRQAARASKKLYTISLNCHLFLPKIKNCVKYCSQFADIMDASERDGVPKKGRSEP